MTDQDLTRLRDADLCQLMDKLCGYQGSLGDAEHIDDEAVERVEARIRRVQKEVDRRKEISND